MVCITSSSMLCPITSLPCENNIKFCYTSSPGHSKGNLWKPLSQMPAKGMWEQIHIKSPHLLSACLTHPSSLSEQPLLFPLLLPIYHRLPQQLHVLRRCTRTATYNLVSKHNLFKTEVKAFLSLLPFNLLIQQHNIFLRVIMHNSY